MSVEFESVKRLDALKQGIEAKTGETYADLTSGVNALIAGYGSGGGISNGIVYTETDEATGLPTVVDISGLNSITEKISPLTPISSQRLFASMFANDTTTVANGGMFCRLREVIFCDNIYYFSNSMFYNCTQLKTLKGDFSKTMQIGHSTFKGCSSLSKFPYMPELISLQTNAFNGCTGLTEFKMYETSGTNSVTIIGNAFAGCTNLKDIYVPWAEGEVANAPWGAINATIHYNTVYDENHNPIE